MSDLQSIARDIAAELATAVYVVTDFVDEDCLAAIGFAATLGGVPAALSGFLIGAEAKDVVLVGSSARLASWLAIELPHVRVRVLSCVTSPATVLGHALDLNYDDLAVVDKKATTWLQIVAGHSRIADLDHAPLVTLLGGGSAVSPTAEAGPVTIVRRVGR